MLICTSIPTHHPGAWVRKRAFFKDADNYLPPISEVKVTLEHHESASTRCAQADAEASGQSDNSSKKAKIHQNTTGEVSTIHGGREGEHGGILGGGHGGVEGGVHGGIHGGVQVGIHKTTNLPHGFSFDPAEGFKLDDPQHEVGKAAKPMLMMNVRHIIRTNVHDKMDNEWINN